MEKLLYPQHPLKCVISGPSNPGRSVFLTNLILTMINEYIKFYIYSPNLHREFYRK